jgi:hypothetical protein
MNWDWPWKAHLRLATDVKDLQEEVNNLEDKLSSAGVINLVKVQTYDKTTTIQYEPVPKRAVDLHDMEQRLIRLEQKGGVI